MERKSSRSDIEQAQRVRDNLKLFEAPGGLLTSTRVTGNQWDAPYGWAPLQMIPLDGLRRYGYDADADRISRSFLSMVTQDFEEHGAIVEKYDVQRRRSDVAAGIKFGYSANQVGFGWTNAAFLDLLAGLEHRPAAKAAEAGGSGIDTRRMLGSFPRRASCRSTCRSSRTRRRRGRT